MPTPVTLRRVLGRCKATVLLAAFALTGCGWRAASWDWIGEHAAIVHCTVSGSNYTLPKLAVELPAPATPTGLYARVLDPMALDDLGYTRDEIVCASLEPPTQVELSETKAALAKLIEERGRVDLEARKTGPCACEAARALDMHALLASCVNRPWQPNCEVREFERRDMAKLLEPLQAALAAAAVPRVHWRLAGPTDRPGRFMARISELLPRHSGGSDVFQRGETVPKRLNHVLISGLLEEDGVLAVVRQDSGTALLVVRALGGQLVLDHFAYPEVSPGLVAFLPFIDNAQLDRYRAQLAKPAAARKLALDPAQGTLVELDRAGLEQVDAGLALAAVLGRGYALEREQRLLPPLVFDRATFQVPFGEEGQTARAVLRFGDEGKVWAAGLTESPISSLVDEVEASPIVPALVPGGPNPGFLSRGGTPEQVWFAGAHRFVEIMRVIENEVPGSLRGSGLEWTLTIPSGPLPGEFYETLEELKRLRERLSKRPHLLSAKMASDRSALELTLTPK